MIGHYQPVVTIVNNIEPAIINNNNNDSDG